MADKRPTRKAGNVPEGTYDDAYKKQKTSKEPAKMRSKSVSSKKQLTPPRIQLPTSTSEVLINQPPSPPSPPQNISTSESRIKKQSLSPEVFVSNPEDINADYTKFMTFDKSQQLITTVGQLQKINEDLSAKLELAGKTGIALSNKLEEQTKAAQEYVERNVSEGRRIDTYFQKIKVLEEQEERNESTIKALNEQIKKNEQEITNARNELTTLQIAYRTSENKLMDVQGKYAKQQTRLSAAVEDLKKVQEKTSVQLNMKDDMARKKDVIMADYQLQINEMKDQIKQYQHDENSFIEDIRVLDNDKKELERRIEFLTSLEKQEDNDEVHKQIFELRKNLEDMEKQNIRIAGERNDNEERLKKTQEDLDAANRNNDTLNNLNIDANNRAAAALNRADDLANKNRKIEVRLGNARKRGRLQRKEIEAEKLNAKRARNRYSDVSYDIVPDTLFQNRNIRKKLLPF